MISKSLQGSTVKRVYWAVNHPHWVPVIGEPFDSPVEARKYAEDEVTADSPRALIETRIVFEFPKGHYLAGTFDIVVSREYAEYETVIRRLSED